jgi:hypothetical protein
MVSALKSGGHQNLTLMFTAANVWLYSALDELSRSNSKTLICRAAKYRQGRSASR